MMMGTPKIKCVHCGKETIKAIHIHICTHCKKDYRK
jgi:Zn finger protein HypA/HybF involved in hydrogenase expression